MPEDTLEDKINRLRGVIECPREILINALQTCEDLDKLATEYLVDAAAFRQKYSLSWDDTVFSPNDNGPSQTGIAFHIDSPDNAAPAESKAPYGYMPPSRPPSRATHSRSPLGPTTKEQEDEDLNRAIEESVASGRSAQQSGVIHNVSERGFGPANRDEYDSHSWAMVHVERDAQVRNDGDALPSARRREPHTPAFLVQGESWDNRLGPILTILHEIPVARNILLQLGAPALTYGHNPEWWKGQPILQVGAVTAHHSGASQWDYTDCYEELHRLMAFLDSGERSYASIASLVGALTQRQFGSLEEGFYKILMSAENRNVATPLLHLVRLFGEESSSDDLESADRMSFAFFDIEMMDPDEWSELGSFDEMWDHYMWSRATTGRLPIREDDENFYLLGDATQFKFFEAMGDALAVRIGGNGPPEPFELPSVWLPERYLKTRLSEALGLQGHWAVQTRCVTQLKERLRQVSQCQGPNGENLDLIPELDRRIAKQQAWLSYLDRRARFRAFKDSDFNETTYPNGYTDAPAIMTNDETELKAELEGVIQNLEHKKVQAEEQMKECQSRLARHREIMRVLGTTFTDPARERPDPLTCKRFFLRGVATEKDVVYICRRSRQVLVEIDDDTERRDQWWRLQLSPGAQPVKTEKVEFEQIQRQVWKESRNPILIFATEEGLNQPPLPLRESLHTFVKHDNRYFHQELSQESKDPMDPARTPLSPSKRKHRSGSPDSMSTNRASHGSSRSSRNGDFSMDPDPFCPGQDVMDTELEDVSVLSGVPATVKASLAASGAFSEDLGESPPGGMDGSTAAPLQEMKEIATKPIFILDQNRRTPPSLLDRD